MVAGPLPREDDEPTSPVEPDESILQAVNDVDTEASDEVMSLLAQHVPLALLADLASPQGPASPEILQDEGLPDVAWWEGEEQHPAPGPAERGIPAGGSPDR